MLNVNQIISVNSNLSQFFYHSMELYGAIQKTGKQLLKTASAACTYTVCVMESH